MSINAEARLGRRRVERGIYEQPNGKYMVCLWSTASRDSASWAST
jgi:hypothetical protein